MYNSRLGQVNYVVIASVPPLAALGYDTMQFKDQLESQMLLKSATSTHEYFTSV